MTPTYFSYFSLATAATLLLLTASCSQYKKTEETTTPPAPPATTLPSTTTTTTAPDTAAYRASAGQLADRVAADLRVTDAGVKNRLRQVYYSRGRVLQTLAARPDTAGNYAATKIANDLASSQVRAAVTDPAAYRTYVGNAGNYYAGPYTAAAAAATPPAAPARHSLGARVGQGSGVKKLENTDKSHKVKYENGAKIKRSADGSLKIKRADGTKVKIDEDGNRTVKKGLL